MATWHCARFFQTLQLLLHDNVQHGAIGSAPRGVKDGQSGRLAVGGENASRWVCASQESMSTPHGLVQHVRPGIPTLSPTIS